MVGRGGDGGLPHLAFGAWTSDPNYTFTRTRRDGCQGAPGLMNRHSKLNLIIDGRTLARGGSGGGATPSGTYTELSCGVQGVPGGAGAPFGRVMTGQPGAGGTAIVGVAPLTTKLINGGKILQTL